MDETLFMALQRYGREDAIPMHMPGHKRNEALAPYLKALGAGLDITEIDGFDDLHGAEGILRRGKMCIRDRAYSCQIHSLLSITMCGPVPSGKL